ncbi:MAG TPA: phenylalanine--tRNA ligase subunit beta [Ferruginibacter sp.]|jgi:phenylalanyl-tRNA synthetase beta chain|nr:phenylalanine--tRNA ligase subunit beta [Ferruginibacter sp.]
MTISYNWLSEYLPETVAPEELSKILTSIGLEVETLEKYEELKGGLQGLVIGEVMECEKHPDADKLSITKVDIGTGELLQIVCGAPNVAKGQKVVVATVGSTIYPSSGEPMTMKKAKIRGTESFGMICAEDEIGLGTSHAGIMILPADTKLGSPAADYFKPNEDFIFEIGLTPNRMDAMSHLGVAKDVCAYLTYHNKKETSVKLPFKSDFKADSNELPISVTIENKEACQRYSGVSIKGVTVAESPAWLKQKLKSIGLRPINNIVDITNFILHETGQPLHAFDASQIKGNKVIVKNVAEGTPFITLDEKERKLSAEDLIISNESEPMCIAGVFGGLTSGVKNTTTDIFLESAWFSPTSIRKTSFRHGLRTDAATRFEKGVDISNTVNVLKRAALLIKEIAGGKIASEVIDVYPAPKAKAEVTIQYAYLKKLSGKNYPAANIKSILTSLGFELIKEDAEQMSYTVPYSKPDITIAADIVEEIMRIDGLDNVEIPSAITISPSVETLAHDALYKEKIANYLVGEGFNEIFTNSITNSAYFSNEVLQTTVKMINNLSEELNVMRPSMMETGLESIAHNLNRKNTDLKLFEFGKTYATSGIGNYSEKQHLSIYITGKKTVDSWKGKGDKADFYFAKAVFEKIIELAGVRLTEYTISTNTKYDSAIEAKIKKYDIATIGSMDKKNLATFDIKQPVFYIDIDWEQLIALSKKAKIEYKEISKFPAVQRDLAIVVDKSLKYEQVEKATKNAQVNRLQSISLFDIFESEKLGANKKSLAVNFIFLDEEKTMTDKDIDAMMSKIIASYEKELQAEIRK